jgi:hypothetical protein
MNDIVVTDVKGEMFVYSPFFTEDKKICKDIITKIWKDASSNKAILEACEKYVDYMYEKCESLRSDFFEPISEKWERIDANDSNMDNKIQEYKESARKEIEKTFNALFNEAKEIKNKLSTTSDNGMSNNIFNGMFNELEFPAPFAWEKVSSDGQKIVAGTVAAAATVISLFWAPTEKIYDKTKQLLGQDTVAIRDIDFVNNAVKFTQTNVLPIIQSKLCELFSTM